MFYVPEGSPYMPRGGAYVMAPGGPAVVFPGPRAPPTLRRGPVYEELEVLVDKDSGISQTFRLYRGQRLLHITTAVVKVSLKGGSGKEVIVRLESSAVGGGDTLYTDSNGLEFVIHRRNVIAGRFDVDNAISGNYYPVSVAGFIR
jgi:hypothetical protein